MFLSIIGFICMVYAINEVVDFLKLRVSILDDPEPLWRYLNVEDYMMLSLGVFLFVSCLAVDIILILGD